MGQRGKIMIVKFQSTAAADVITFADVARLLLRLLGKEPTARGVIAPGELDQAVARLEGLEKPAKDGKAQLLEDSGVGMEPHEVVALATRAQPFIRMFAQAAKAEKAVTWEAAQDFYEDGGLGIEG